MPKILVVDDERPTLDMLNLFLGVYGYEVLVADNASAGLELFEKEQPPVVLTDIKMPGQDGLNMLKQMKAIDANAQVIVVTGHGDKDLAKKAYALGATEFLNKPLDVEALKDALEKAMDNWRRRND